MPANHRLGQRVSRLARIMQVRLEGDLAPLGLTRLGALVLSGIGDDGLIAPSELADHAGITRPALSRLLRGLEERGLITRTAGQAEDGRQTAVALTPEGAAALVRVRAAFDALQDHFTAKLTPEALAALSAMLDTLAAGEPAPTAY
ncbi:MAG: MarR family transcriptional regulator [Rhodobacter sp.]|nr:MarR family transcriptional regulator [Paracoccaceae bacterium]MCC0076011.1 MarR family transcriptional regulator [Rhodobacter sp.]